MDDLTPDEAGLRALLEQIGERVRATVDDTAAECVGLDEETEVDVLHVRLRAIPGLEFDREWAQRAVATLRRGEPLEIQIG